MMQPFKGTASEWNTLITGLSSSHLLQTWEWSQVKANYGWEPMPFDLEEVTGRQLDKLDLSAAAAMVLETTHSYPWIWGALEHLVRPQRPADGLVR